MVTEEEKAKRREAVEYAKTSVGLEGITLSEGLLEIADKYIQGLLTREEFTKEYIAAVKAGVHKEEIKDKLSFIRLTELKEQPLQGQFDLEHLKKLNAYIFQDTPEVAGKFRREIDPESGSIWLKQRDYSKWGDALICYSNLNKSDIKQAETTLSKINIPYLKTLDKTEFAKEISTLYAKLDQFHPFPDGNSRTLREFTRTLALEAGYELDWKKIPHETLYAARDVEVNKISIAQFQNNPNQKWMNPQLKKEINALLQHPSYKPLEQAIQDSLSISKQIDPKTRYEQLKHEVLEGKGKNMGIKTINKEFNK